MQRRLQRQEAFDAVACVEPTVHPTYLSLQSACLLGDGPPARETPSGPWQVTCGRGCAVDQGPARV